MTTMTDILSNLDDQGAFFDVFEESTGDVALLGKKVIKRKDDGMPLGIVSKKYNTVTTQEQLSRFGEGVERAGLDLEGATAEVRFANGGARTMIHMRFPAHEISVRGDDKSILEIVQRNSYDGRWKYGVRGGACRYACFNGMLLGDWLASYSEYHNAKLDVQLAANKVTSILASFNDTGSAWTRMLAAKITDDQAWRVISRYNRKEDDFKAGLKSCREAARSTVSTKMMEQYEKSEKPEIGANAFGIYNTLTHHATHAQLRDGKEAVSLDLRNGRVAEVLASKYWNERVCPAA